MTKIKRTKQDKLWLPLYYHTNRSGNLSYVVDLGEVDGKLVKPSFKDLAEAETYRTQCRIKRQNDGIAALNVPREIQLQAVRPNEILAPHNLSIKRANQVLAALGLAIGAKT